ncbi:hypothetical protein [Pseudolactococcus yaeyamensis]
MFENMELDLKRFELVVVKSIGQLSKMHLKRHPQAPETTEI